MDSLAKDDLEAYAIAIVFYWRMQFDMGEGLVNFSWILAEDKP